MFACNYRVENCGNYSPMETSNGYTEEQISFWDPNYVDYSENNVIDKNSYQIDHPRMQQQCQQKLVQCQVASSNINQPFTDKESLENSIKSIASTASLQWSPYMYANSSQKPYFSAQWPYSGNKPPSTLQTHQQNLNKTYKINHLGKITIGKTTSSCFKAVVKRKRKRTIFTTEQIEALEKIFNSKPYITREDRQYIVNQLNLSDKSIKIWFQNRRLKGKRQDNEASDDVLEENDIIDADSLDIIESKIRKNTDEFGYVTLDDRIMSDLVSIIDDCLTRNCDVDVSPSSDVKDNSDSSIYEPISPASSEYLVEHSNMTDWEPFEPMESLQRLLDIQSLIQL